MKVCILSAVNFKHMTQVEMFLSHFENNGIDYDIVYFDKYGIDETVNADNVYKFEKKIPREWSKVRKIFAYTEFRAYAKKVLNENNYDYIVVWRTETAYLFIDLLLINFRNKFILNIRDYFNEKNLLFYFFTWLLIFYSKFTTISSKGFFKFLPRLSNIVPIHSLNQKIISKLVSRREKSKFPINICFVGYVRFFDQDKKLISELGNDERFTLSFYGDGAEILRKFADDNKINNVVTHGGFLVEETPCFLEKADIINNLYGAGSLDLDTAISIKYYYALHLSIPIIVFKNTYMEEVSGSAGIGYAVDLNYSGLGDKLANWYDSLSFDHIKDRCNAELSRVYSENSDFKKMLDEHFRCNFN